MRPVCLPPPPLPPPPAGPVASAPATAVQSTGRRAVAVERTFTATPQTLAAIPIGICTVLSTTATLTRPVWLGFAAAPVETTAKAIVATSASRSENRFILFPLFPGCLTEAPGSFVGLLGAFELPGDSR